MYKWLLLLLLSPCIVAKGVSFKSRVQITGIAVSSVCTVSVNNGVSKSGIIDFGVYNKATRTGVDTHPFSLYLYEEGATKAGCDAFLAGNDFVNITFGGEGDQQLDNKGVITTGAGDNIRIEVVATDVKASTHRPVTAKNNVISYDKNFATQGVFNFNATPCGLDTASAGQYRGKLSIIITYQ